MTQKVIRVGKSAAVTLPKSFLRKVGWKVGSLVEVATDDVGGEVHVRLPGTRGRRLSPEFIAWADEFIERYRPVLEKLARH